MPNLGASDGKIYIPLQLLLLSPLKLLWEGWMGGWMYGWTDGWLNRIFPQSLKSRKNIGVLMGKFLKKSE